MDPSSLVVGNLYSVNIILPFDDAPISHRFTTDRIMRYDGIDEDWRHGTSYIFSDDIDLYRSIEEDPDSLYVFGQMTNVCASDITDGRWSIHICQRRHDGKEILRVEGSVPRPPPLDESKTPSR